ncbi:DUF2953 domain-containing protein [Methanothermobacter sp. THM-2]|nr:DUF2953 domain-containing protein [Methanothermobacter sp. THM-2]
MNGLLLVLPLIFLAVLLLVLLALPYRLILSGVRDAGRTDLRISLMLWGMKFLSKRFKSEIKEETMVEAKPRPLREVLLLGLKARWCIMDLIGALLSSITIRRARISVSVGLGEASDTAIITGYLWAISALTSSLRNIEINAAPDFFSGDVNGNFELELSLRPLKPVLVFIMLLLKRPFREFVLGLREFS